MLCPRTISVTYALAECNVDGLDADFNAENQQWAIDNSKTDVLVLPDSLSLGDVISRSPKLYKRTTLTVTDARGMEISRPIAKEKPIWNLDCFWHIAIDDSTFQKKLEKNASLIVVRASIAGHNLIPTRFQYLPSGILCNFIEEAYAL